MTTIIYKSGVLFADTCVTDESTGETSLQNKIFAIGEYVFGASGYLGLALIFTQKKFIKLLKLLPFFPIIDFCNCSDKGNYARIILADKKEVKVYAVENIWKSGVFSIFKRKLVFRVELEKNIIFSIGSGSSEEVNDIAKEYSPEEAIIFASSVDKYTNDIITKLDIRQLFGV